MIRPIPDFRALTTALVCALLGVAGCRQQEDAAVIHSGFKDFVPLYNKHIHGWLTNQLEATEQDLAQAEARLAEATGEAAERLKSERDDLLREREKYRFRLALGDYLKFGTPDEIPTDLEWQSGMDQPEIGDPAARKGGVFRNFVDAFPPTIRPFGSNSNNSFRGDLYDYIDVPLVGMHPMTMQMIPGIAREWAVSADGRTTYFRLNKDARYSDGVPVRAMDYLFNCYIRVSDNIVNPYGKQYFRENIAQIACYDDLTLSISMPEAKLYAPAIAGGLTPCPPHFYEEYGPDYEERYQWRFPPTTGAYVVREEDIVKGVSITQTRLRDWWAKDLKYYRYRFNPDKIVTLTVRDEAKAFELFRAGEIDTFFLNRPELWYEKSEMEPVYKGYIERVTFYTQYPKIPRGLYLNVIQPPLDNRNVRIGIDYSMNWQKVIDLMYRGDAQLLNAFNEGYGQFSDPSLRARGYSINKAREAFAEAGYTEEDKNGILQKPDGTKLSIALTYRSAPFFDKMMSILREDAKACGLDLRLDNLEATVCYKKCMQKQHQMTFTGWMITPPTPDFYQFLHSRNAFDDKGNPKPQTNNLNSWGRQDTDQLCEITRNAKTEEELRDAAWKLQNIMRDEAIFIPGYTIDFLRMGSWRWVRWPDCENTRFSPPVVYDPRTEIHVHWVDTDIQRETLAAMRSGKSYGESIRTIDTYRTVNDKAPAAPKVSKPAPTERTELPQPELPQPELPQPELPQPELPQPELPEPEASTPEIPMPEPPESP